MDVLNRKRLQSEVQSRMKSLRELSKKEHSDLNSSTNQVLFTEERSGYYNGNNVKRLVLFLKGTGCTYAMKNGGCTFCGFYNATNFGVKIPDKDYIEQVNNSLEHIDNLDTYPIICLYNDGSMLKEEEISFQVVFNVIKQLSTISTVKKIVLEAKLEDIDEEKLILLRSITDKEIEIAVGFESANPIVRDVCINKSFELKIFEEKVNITKKYKISLIPLLMLKPPFLTEEEAINDYIDSLIYLEKFGLSRIDMELPTIELYTLMNELWKQRLYTPAKLWSVIKIIEIRSQLNISTPLYISPTNYSVQAEAKASNCDICSNDIYLAFEEFNLTGDSLVFQKFNCLCKQEWEKLLLEEKNVSKLDERVANILSQLD